MTNEELRLEIAKLKGWKFWSITGLTATWAKAPGADDVREMFIAGFPAHQQEPSPSLMPTELPDWPADIASAWELVVDAEQADVWFELSNVIPNSDPVVYEVRFHGKGGGMVCL